MNTLTYEVKLTFEIKPEDWTLEYDVDLKDVPAECATYLDHYFTSFFQKWERDNLITFKHLTVNQRRTK